ncbi:organic cation transporter -like [Paramuricea clavata]|uniref:Organic cation transporter -like n=1 Tax=Paramuricea clavata TaxID=317549 RepID=A0A6S7KUA3_PARCT|nr:organic cation transporter -like [Paramuricea clavata]
MYFNFALTSLIEIPAHFLAIDNCERIGRKKTVIIYMILGGIACVVVSLIPAGTERTDFIVGRVIGGMLGKGFITVSYGAIVVWSTELFPTIVRNSGMAITYVSTCLGSAAAPFVLELDRIHPILPFGLMGGLAVVAALLGLLLPETRGRPTAEVFESKNSEKATETIILNRNIEDQNEKIS